MPDGLYEHDALAWSEQQAALLRRLAAGERVNEAVDWANVIEEVHDVGVSELHACRSLLRQALVHLIKLHLEPEALAADHWRSEIVGFLADGRNRFAPSMRRRIDLQDVFQDAVHGMSGVRTRHRDGTGTRFCVSACPFNLDDLLSERPDIDALAQRLGQESNAGRT